MSPVVDATGVAQWGLLLVVKGETPFLETQNGPGPEAIEVKELPRPLEVPALETQRGPRGHSENGACKSWFSEFLTLVAQGGPRGDGKGGAENPARAAEEHNMTMPKAYTGCGQAPIT